MIERWPPRASADGADAKFRRQRRGLIQGALLDAVSHGLVAAVGAGALTDARVTMSCSLRLRGVL
jgi:hypothetical protein